MLQNKTFSFKKVINPIEKEIDWEKDFGCHGLNLSTMQFERVSMVGAPKSIIHINLYADIADYSEDVAEMAKADSATFLLYKDYYVVGYVVES